MKKIFESFKETFINEERFTAGEEEIWDLKEPITSFIKKQPEDRDIFITKDGKAHVTNRHSNLNFHGKDGRTYRGLSLDNVKGVWAGFEQEFYEPNDFFKMLQSVYHGRKSRVKPININESLNESKNSFDSDLFWSNMKRERNPGPMSHQKEKHDLIQFIMSFKNNKLSQEKLEKYSNEDLKNIKRDINESFINESNEDIKTIYKQTRMMKSVEDSAFLFYFIKNYLDIGYWDKVNEKKFKGAYDDVMKFYNKSGNMQRLADKYNWMTTFDELWLFQQNKED